MKGMDNTIVANYLLLLKKTGIQHNALPHPELRSITDVQNYLGFGLDESLATLIMKTEKGYVAVIRRGDCKLDSKKVKKELGVENLRMATDEEFAALTGVVPGAAHILHPVSQTIIDKRVFDNEYCNGGSGSLTVTIRYKTADLMKIPASRMADITEEVVATTASTANNRVFSGIRATGRLHLGNYLGAVKGMLELQNTSRYQTVYCVVDVHTITTPFDPEALRRNKRDIFIDYLAAGLDPQKSILIYQSDVPEHTELSFYFSSVMSIARMQHLPTFKDKVKQYPQNATMALLNYPILMAADILVYKAGLVPVGIDQEPHLEVAREIARKMNEKYGTDFPEPVRFATKGEYVPSLTGEGKMSKSVEGSYINLTDTLEIIKKKVAKIPTDSGIRTKTGELPAVMPFVRLFMGEAKAAQLENEYASTGIKYGQLKAELAEAIFNELEPLQQKRRELELQPDYVDRVIREGAEKARSIARKTVDDVKQKMGLS